MGMYGVAQRSQMAAAAGCFRVDVVWDISQSADMRTECFLPWIFSY
jgi:hypothetical protein